MGLSYGECDRLAKMIPFDLKMTLEKALKQSPSSKRLTIPKETTHDLIETAFPWKTSHEMLRCIAAGVVIGDQPLVNSCCL